MAKKKKTPEQKRVAQVKFADPPVSVISEDASDTTALSTMTQASSPDINPVVPSEPPHPVKSPAALPLPKREFRLPTRPREHGVVPRPGHIYMIRERDTGYSIVQKWGYPVVEEARGSRGGHYWECFEDRGWLGFQNIVSGNFLGVHKLDKIQSQDDYNFVTIEDYMDEDELFMTRPDTRGGYELIVLREGGWWGLDIQDGELKMIECCEDEGTRFTSWEFIRM